eukprot:11130574-Prorocentrum_lima.AAC.1
MTSSLVGSEMCIRDRVTHSENVGQLAQEAKTINTLTEAMCVGLDNELSVSYTHLTLPTICSV